MTRPPCWKAGKPCPNACAQALHDRTVYNRQHLPEPWTGWRMAGRDLVAPDGVRFSPERLRGLVWRQATEERRDRYKRGQERVSRMVVDLRVRARNLVHTDPDELAG